MLKYAIKLKICSNGSNMPKYAFITFAWKTPFIENSSDFDASFDSSHIEKICFCMKIRALDLFAIYMQYIFSTWYRPMVKARSVICITLPVDPSHS